MQINLLLIVASIQLNLGCSTTNKPIEKEPSVKFYVDPATNSDDMEIRMAYGLNIVPPWPDGGSIFVNLPEHLAYLPETKGIARHHDKRKNVWQAKADSTEAFYDVVSLSEPDVFMTVKAKSINQRATFEFTLTNRTHKTFKSLIPMFCFQYKTLKGFPERLTNNFAHTYIVIDGKLALVADLPVQDSSAVARGAQVKDCTEEHNWWTMKMGGFISQRIDEAVTILTASNDDRKVVLHWTPGKAFLSNSFIPCIHADACMGDLPPLDSKTIKGELIFTRAPLDQILKQLSSL